MMRYAPKTKPVPPPCGRDCPGRAPGCSAMCCSWMLYQSIREHIYQKQLAEKHAQELNFVAQREIAHAGRKVRKEGAFVCGKIAPITRESGHRAGRA